MKESFKLENKTTIYMNASDYYDHSNEIQAISDYLLKKCKNLSSLDFSDISASGIQLGGCLTSNPGYIYLYKTIKYDWSNVDVVIADFIDSWNKINEEEIESFKNFTDEGEKYGWD